MMSSVRQLQHVNIEKRNKKRQIPAIAFGLDCCLTTHWTEIYRLNFKYWFEKSGMSKAALGRAIGKAPSAINHYLNGRMCPVMDTAGRIADVLGVPLTEFFQDPPYGAEGARSKIAVTFRDSDRDPKSTVDPDVDELMRNLARLHGGEFRKKRKKTSR